MGTHSRKTPADRNLALRLEVERLRRGWTVTELGKAGGKSTAAASHWIHGRNEPAQGTLRRLAGAFGMTIDRLTGAGLTAEQLEAERRYLMLVIDAKSPELLDALASLLDRFGPEKSLALIRGIAENTDQSKG